MNLYEAGAAILISVFTCLVVLHRNKLLRKYITESSKETRANFQKTRAKIEKSGEETRAKMRNLSQMLMKSRHATRGELKEMLETMK